MEDGMGLDMYLYKRHYVKGKQLGELTKQVLDKLEPTIRLERISTIYEQVAYWRKANQIHQWFVDHVLDGDDNCREHECELTQLRELLGVVKRVLDDHKLAEEEMPTMSGFFYGSTEYDEDYFDDLRDTERMLSEIIEEGCGDNSWFVYRASW
jgi:hypothetical protein